MLNKLITGGVQKGAVYGICYLEGHATDACLTLQRGDVNAIFSNQGQRKYDPTPTLIVKDGETTQTLGMDLGITSQVLTNHHINHLLRIEQIFF